MSLQSLLFTLTQPKPDRSIRQVVLSIITKLHSFGSNSGWHSSLAVPYGVGFFRRWYSHADAEARFPHDGTGSCLFLFIFLLACFFGAIRDTSASVSKKLHIYIFSSCFQTVGWFTWKLSFIPDRCWQCQTQPIANSRIRCKEKSHACVCFDFGSFAMQPHWKNAIACLPSRTKDTSNHNALIHFTVQWLLSPICIYELALVPNIWSSNSNLPTSSIQNASRKRWAVGPLTYII